MSKESEPRRLIEEDGVLEYWRLRFLVAGFDEYSVNTQFDTLIQMAENDPAYGMKMKREKVPEFRKYFNE